MWIQQCSFKYKEPKAMNFDFFNPFITDRTRRIDEIKINELPAFVLVSKSQSVWEIHHFTAQDWFCGRTNGCKYLLVYLSKMTEWQFWKCFLLLHAHVVLSKIVATLSEIAKHNSIMYLHWILLPKTIWICFHLLKLKYIRFFIE